ncbi:MAG: hypothetical protein ACHQIK_21795 [Candidatus Acidiferrales bacterium]
MELQNIEEYKELRHEIATLKGCITTYVGFVFLVVSPAYWELAKAIPSRPNPTMALVALLVGLGLKLVLILLLYKFNSHNRYCGYCKLLEHEIFGGKDKYPKAVFIWEICLDRLRSSDFRPDGLANEIRHYRGSQPQEDTLLKMAKQYSGVAPEADEPRFRMGWKLLLTSGPEPRGTWQFPLYVARIFAAIDLGLLGLGLALLLPHDAASTMQIFHKHAVLLSLPFLLWLLFFLLLLLSWRKFMADLYRQMNGSQTVDAFCWRFVPIRYRILDDLDLATGYKLIGANPLPRPEAGWAP